jgi:colanic acid/amylovoran biosynthesis glycosyltransferase
MKIAFIVNLFPKLSETFILNQITGLLDMGHEVEIFAEYNPQEEKIQFDVKKYNLMEKVHYFNIPNSKIKRLLKAIYLLITNLHNGLLKILRSLNIFKYRGKALSLWPLYRIIPFLDKEFDIIQCHYGSYGNIGAYLKQIGIKGKLVTMFHGCDIRLGIEKGKDNYHQVLKYGDCFLAISEYNYRNIIGFGADPKKVILHPVGIYVDKFPYRKQINEVKIPKTIIIITIARLVEEKGIEYGIKAINKLLKSNNRTNLKYRIIGDGGLEDNLRKLVEELNLSKLVEFLGSMEQEEVIREMLNSHIFLLPSIAEALPVVLFEAQAVGLPIVSTNVGGVSQAIIDGKSGFLVPERNVDALAEKLRYLIEHPELWSEMGRYGRIFVEEKYDVKKLNKRLVQVYQDLLQEGQLNLNDLKMKSKARSIVV